MAFFLYSGGILTLATAVQLLLPINTNAFSCLGDLSTLHSRFHASKSRQKRGLSVAFAIPPGRVEDIDKWIKWSSDSLEKVTGESLIDRMDGVESVADVHRNDRYGVVSHGTQDDPLFNYCNKAALQVFQYPEDEVYRIPTRYSAPPENRDVRAGLIDDAKENDFLVIASAVRQTKFGEKFVINNILLWNVYDDAGIRVGQTAVYDRKQIVPLEIEE